MDTTELDLECDETESLKSYPSSSAISRMSTNSSSSGKRLKIERSIKSSNIF